MWTTPDIYSSEPEGEPSSGSTFSILRKDFLHFFLLICQSVRVCAPGKQTDALEKTREGRNQSRRLILLTVLSLGESGAVSNRPGQWQKKKKKDLDQYSEGAHILLRVRTAAIWAEFPYWPSSEIKLIATCTDTLTHNFKCR